MAELAIHDPHYFNVESEQKTAIVHLFHNPIPADGPREEGPEWAKEVDDIYLIGGVGPEGPTVKTVVNDEVTEWSAGGGQKTVAITITNNTEFNISNCAIIEIFSGLVVPYVFQFNNGATFSAEALITDGYITIETTRNFNSVKLNDDEILIDKLTPIANRFIGKIDASKLTDGDNIIIS